MYQNKEANMWEFIQDQMLVMIDEKVVSAGKVLKAKDVEKYL